MPSKRGRKWIAQVRIAGKKRQKIFESKREALDWEAAERSGPEEKSIETPMVSLLEWATAYLEYCEKLSRGTHVEKRSLFRRFFRHHRIAPKAPVTELRPMHVLDYLKAQFKVRSGYSTNKDRKNLIAAYNWGMKYLALPGPNPCLVDRFPEERSPRYVPPEEDFWKVYDASKGQDRVMLLAYLHLAARRGELFRLKWEDVDFENRRVRLYTRKRLHGSWESDWLPMSDELSSALGAHRQVFGGEYVFVDPHTMRPLKYGLQIMNRLCDAAGVRRFGFHAIRHLAASSAAHAGIPMMHIRGFLRHRNLATTERYLHQMKDLRPILAVLSRKKKPSAEPSTAQRGKVVSMSDFVN